MIAQLTLDAVKQRIDIVTLIGEYVTLKKNGSNHVGLCPFHDEKSGSFTVSKSKDMFKCFGCGKSGDSITFVMEHQKTTYPNALKFLAAKYNIEVLEETTENKKTYEKPTPRLEKLSKKTIEYFEKNRGISNNTLLRFNVTECLEWMPKAQKEVPTICFNFYQNDELVNIKFRAKNKDFKLNKDSKLIFYNIDAIDGTDDAIICEGEIDAMSFYEANEYNVVSVPNGAATGKLNLEYLDNCYKYFENKERIYIASDGDAAGKKLAEELCRRLGKERCLLVQYPEGCKDTNEVLLKYGKQAVNDLILNAKLYPLEGESTMEDMFPTLQDFYKNGYPKGCNSGMLDELGDNDSFVTFIPQQLTMVTGINGHGKDEVVNNICMGLAKINGWKTAVCQFEENTEITASKLLEKYTNKAFDFRKDTTQRMNPDEFNEGVLFVSEYFKLMNVDEMDTTIDSIIEKAKQMIVRYGINCLVISPWNCIEHQIPIGMPETQYISQTLSKLTSFIKKYHIHCFLVAHPTKMQKNLVTKKYEIPTMQNISGSVHFANKTHNGLSIYRNFEDGTTEVHVQKVKFYWLGRVGMRLFDYDRMTRRYTGLDVAEVKPQTQQPQPPPNFKKIEVVQQLEQADLWGMDVDRENEF